MNAVIYTRLSVDSAGEGLGVERQREECMALAARLGLEVTHVYTDNGISAYGTKMRPDYLAMLKALHEGTIDTVIAWNLDRLYRRMRDLEDYIDLVEQRGIRTETVLAGSFDLNTPMGRAIARNAIAFATLEVDQSRARVKAAKLQTARAGGWGGGQRPYGYESDGMTIRDTEAATIKRMASAVINGQSYRTVALTLNGEGITTGHGYEWNALKVRNILTNPRYVGIRVHNPTQHGVSPERAEYKAAWPPILTEDEWFTLQGAIQASRAHHRQRGPLRKYLLNGYVFCGSCHLKLVSQQKVYRDGSNRPIWACVKRRDNGPDGCGSVSRLMAPIDDLIADAVIYRLNSPEVRAALANQHDDDKLADLLKQERATEALIEELLEDRATGLLTRAEYAKAKVSATERLERIRSQIAQASVWHRQSLPHALTREQWDASTIEWQRGVLDVLIERIEVLPVERRDGNARYKTWNFQPDLIRVEWRA